MPVKSKVKILQNFVAFRAEICQKKFVGILEINEQKSYILHVHMQVCNANGLQYKMLKFIYSEKATRFCKIFTLLLTGTK